MIIDEANKIALGFQIGEGLQTQSGIQLPEYKISSKKYFSPYVQMYLIFEKSRWKNQVRQTGFLVYFKLCILQKSILKLIFEGYTGSNNPVRNTEID